MGHDNHQHEANEYYLEQLCAIGFGGLLAGVICKWYFSGQWMKIQEKWTYTGPLANFISTPLILVVLAGGVGLLMLVVFRAVVVWQAAGATQPADEHNHCDDHGHGHGGEEEHGHAHGHGHEGEEEHGHEHEHGHGHGHGHGGEEEHSHAHAGHSHGGHGHDHGHDHGWAPWRYTVMLVPVVLGFLGQPDSSMPPYPGQETDIGEVHTMRPQDTATLVALLAEPCGYGPLLAAPFVDPDQSTMPTDFVPMSFRQMEEATLTPEHRKEFTGTAVELVGQYKGFNDRSFTLIRLRMYCCGADLQELKASIVLDYHHAKAGQRLDPQTMSGKWVQVKGVLQFKDRGNNNFMPVVVITPTVDKPFTEYVKVISRPTVPYE